MRSALLGFAATFLVAGTANAAPPVFPTPTAPPPAITLPIDLNGLLTSLASCPLVEVAPSIFIPLPCGNTLKAIPQTVPVIDLPASTVAPLSVDLRNVGLDGPVKDQARTGVCYAFALSTTLEDSLRRQGRADVLSPLHIIASGAWDDMWGSSPREAIAPEIAWPYDPIKACRFESGRDSCEQSYGVTTDSWRSDPVLVAERERAKGAGVAQVGRAQRIANAKFGDSAVTALARGQSIYLQLRIDATGWSYRNLKGGVITDYDRETGGHAVSVVGYRTTPLGRQFLLHNSWGTDWGERGYAWIDEATIRKHIIDAVLVESVVTGSSPVVTLPPARPNPGPIATTCGTGTLLDIGTGKCAARCPSGLAPAFGRCWLG